MGFWQDVEEMFFGGSGEDTTETTYPGSEYTVKAMQKLLNIGEEGMDPGTLQERRRSIRKMFGEQSSALRTGASQRSMRRGDPTQVQEGIMDIINRRGLSQVSESLNQIDWQNEMMKMNALKGLSGLQRSYKQKYPTYSEGLMSSLIGNIPQAAGMYFGGGG